MSNLKTVYRIEDADCRGMYCTDSTIFLPEEFEVDGIHVDAKVHHPTPQNDALIIENMHKQDMCINKYHQFGFNSIEQLRKWIFNDYWIDKLHKHGFFLSIIQIEERYFIDGNTQVIFDSRQIISKVKKPISMLLETNTSVWE